jgi:SanA protein
MPEPRNVNTSRQRAVPPALRRRAIPGARRRTTAASGSGRPDALPPGVARWLRLTLLLAATGLVAVAGLRLYTVGHYNGAIFDPGDVPVGDTAIVFGAGILPGGEPTAVLYDRVATAAELYRLGKVERIVLTGDGRTDAHNEPRVMRWVALALGVPDGALLLDDAGLRTFDSCRRAKEAFGVATAILVTQRFHLPRALMLCESQGVAAVGVAGDRRSYSWRWRLSWQLRETAATAMAWWEVSRPDADRP